MLHVLATLAAAEAGSHPSKTPFYILGGALAVFAVLIAVFGITRPDFPAAGAQARAVMAFSALVVAGAMATAVLTS